MLRLAATIVTLSVICSAAWGGEFWLITDASYVEDSKPVWISLASGDVFPIASQDQSAPPISLLADRHNGQTRWIGPLRPQDRNLSCRQLHPHGLHVLTCDLSGINDDGRRLRQFAKSMVRVGLANDTHDECTQPVGQDFEIVPLSDPTTWQCGSNLRFRVLLEGYPWPNVSVFAGREGSQSAEPVWTGLSDLQGEFEIRVPLAGHSYVRAVLERPIPSVLGDRSELLRSTFTFHVLPQSKSDQLHGAVAIHTPPRELLSDAKHAGNPLPKKEPARRVAWETRVGPVDAFHDSTDLQRTTILARDGPVEMNQSQTPP